jgi:hypothetical protein
LAFSPPNLPSYLRNGYTQVGKPQSGGDGLWQPETLMLLQTLSTPEPDELAAGFRRWQLRFRQLGGGSFRGKSGTRCAEVVNGPREQRAQAGRETSP